MAVLNSHQQPSVTFKSNTYTRSLRNIKLPSDEAVSTRNPTYKIQGMYQKGLKMFTQNTVKRLKNPLIITSSHNFNSIDHITDLYKDEFRVLTE